MRYVLTNFTGATDPALMPIPFNTVTEAGASVDVLYDSNEGYLSTPCMKVAWTGSPPTHATAYGRILFNARTARGEAVYGANPAITEALDPRTPKKQPYHLRIEFQFGIPTVTGFSTTNDEIEIIRVNYLNPSTNAQEELCTLTWVKKATTGFAWKLKDTLGNVTATGSTLTASAYSSIYKWCFDIILTDGAAHMSIGEAWPFVNFPTGTGVTTQTNSQATLAFLNNVRPPTPTSVDVGCTRTSIGGVAGAAPTAASAIVFDQLEIHDDLYAENSPIGIDHSGSHPIDNAGVRMNFQYFCEFGCITSQNLSGYQVSPPVQIPIIEGEVYEISGTFAFNPYGPPVTGEIGSGYTSIQPFNYSDQTLTFAAPEYACCFPIGGSTRTRVRIPKGANALRLYNGEWTNVDYFIKRIRR